MAAEQKDKKDPHIQWENFTEEEALQSLQKYCDDQISFFLKDIFVKYYLGYKEHTSNQSLGNQSRAAD